MNRSIYLLPILFLFTSITVPAQKTKSAGSSSVKKQVILSRNKSALQSYDDGNKFLASQDLKNAITKFRQAISSDSLFTAAMDSLAGCYRIRGKVDSAVYFYNRSVSGNPKNVFAMANLGIIYVQKNDLAGAEAVYSRIVRTDPTDPDGYFGLAEVMLKTGRYEPATKNALKAYELWKPKYPSYAGDAMLYAGIGKLMSGDKSNAVKYFTEAEKLGTKIPEEYRVNAGMK